MLKEANFSSEDFLQITDPKELEDMIRMATLELKEHGRKPDASNEQAIMAMRMRLAELKKQRSN